MTLLDTGTAARPATSPRRSRLLAVDALRGLAVVGMLLVNNTGLPASTPAELAHSDWHGLTIADLVFPLFLFVVGVAVPLAKTPASLRSVLRRSALLFVIGSLLVSAKHAHFGPSTGVLQHIAGAYLLCWLLLRLPRRWQPVVAIGLLGAVWAAYAMWGGGYEPTQNVAARVDEALLGRFSAEQPHNLPTSMVSVWFGVLAGRALVEHRDAEHRLARLLLLASSTLVAGLALVLAGVPLNKPLWTPSYVLITAGIGTTLLAAAHQVVDRWGARAPARPLVVLGANAIAVYVVTSLAAVLASPWRARVVDALRSLGGARFAAVAYATLFVVAGWAMCEALYRRRYFIKL
ncbi:MAG: heparan-alpha-glucosaminide N-acetyltransferase domain-containing protein [Mycobacteriales bacterium]